MILHNEKYLVDAILSFAKEQDFVAFACSGGVDSMFLTVFGSEILRKKGIKTVALIVDHRLRENSTIQAIQTQKNLRKYGVESVILTWEHETITTAIEERARHARYELITIYCNDHNIKTVFLAHHVDDKLETFVMNAMRGSGLDGLTSMQECVFMRGVEFVRPMIFYMEKSDIFAYMQRNKIPWVEDESNQDIKFTRNGIRQMLGLTKEQKSGMLVAIKNLESIQAEYNLQVEKFFRSVVVENFTVTLPKEAYSLSKEVFFRVVKRVISCVYPLVFREIRQQSVERLYKWLKSTDIQKMTFGNCVFEKTLNCVKVYPEYQKLQISFEEAKVKKNWNNMMEIMCNRACSVVPLGLVEENVRKVFGVDALFLDIAHLPVFMEKKKILAIPHLKIFPDAEFECSV